MASFKYIRSPRLTGQELDTAVLRGNNDFSTTILRSCSGYFARFTTALGISVSLTECYLNVAVCCAGHLDIFTPTRRYLTKCFSVYRPCLRSLWSPGEYIFVILSAALAPPRRY